MSEPLVTCICLTTAARLAWLPRAIEYFRFQTFGTKELLIVSEDAMPVSALVGETRYVLFVRSPRGLTLGAKHNYACSQALGDLIAKWDDDDYSAPGRLADQVERLQSSGKALVGYTDMKFTDGQRWWRYVGAEGWPLGTSLLFRKAWWEHNRFPNDQVGSDNELVRSALLQRQAITAPAGDMMAAAIHPGNLNNRTKPGKDEQRAKVDNPNYFAPLAASEAIPEALACWPVECAA